MEVVQKIAKVLEKEKKVLFAYLFGSYARNPLYAKDIDIAIYVKGKVGLKFEIKLALKIEEKIGKEVEVVILNDKPILFIAEVLKHGKLIFSRDEKARIKFETFALREIFDLNELMEEYDKMRFLRYGIR